MDKKKYLEEVIEAKEKEIYLAELTERFLQRQLLKGAHKESIEGLLGGAQKKIKADKDVLEYYKEVVKEL